MENPSGSGPEIEIRSIEDWNELLACMDLQRATWGEDFDDVISAALLRVCQKIGGIVAGAFDDHSQLIGLVFGLTGVMDGTLVHWSHMLAVRDDWRGRGLGQKLKRFQRDRLLEMGIRHMYWTFDPLESRNAHINFNKLGAEVDYYALDQYGSGESSTLMRGIGTDRFILIWHLDSLHVEQTLQNQRQPLDKATFSTPIINLRSSGTENLPEAPLLRVEVPSDIQTLKEQHPDEAIHWRQVTRRAFSHYLAAGYTVHAFYRDFDAQRSFYVLKSS